jgi:hypothetical protein
MATNRTPLQRTGRRRLNHEQELSLSYGDLPGRPGFASDEERRESWFYHRDRLLQHCTCGRRPMAWWRYEVGDLRYPGYDGERSTLYQAGLLGEDERRELMAWWREQYLQAHAPGFTFCQGPGLFLRGIEARREHLKWADIPAELVEAWSAEQLATAAAEHPTTPAA